MLVYNARSSRWHKSVRVLSLCEIAHRLARKQIVIGELIVIKHLKRGVHSILKLLVEWAILVGFVHTSLECANADIPKTVVVVASEIVIGANIERIVNLGELFKRNFNLALALYFNKTEASEPKWLENRFSVNDNGVNHLTANSKRTVGTLSARFSLVAIKAFKVNEVNLALTAYLKAREAEGEVFCLKICTVEADNRGLVLKVEHRNRSFEKEALVCSAPPVVVLLTV